jgi:catechol 2,3-dioxygenase
MNVITLPQPVAIAPHRIHPQTHPGYVHLKVVNLENQLAFYQEVLGLRLHWKEENSAGLGAGGADLVRLTEIPNGRRYRGVTGIYHFAILFPNRRELARAISRLFAQRWTNYPTDHIMTKTTYLDDPEGNNIELYCESPEDGIFEVRNGEIYSRHADGRLSNGREPLDLDALFSHLKEDDHFDPPVPPETRTGHFHLYVSDLKETLHFYHDLLGFDDMGTARAFRMGMVSAGSYHHHIGFNTWQGEGAPPPPPDALGLKKFSFVLPDRAAMDQLLARIEEVEMPYNQNNEGILVTDPAQNSVQFSIETNKEMSK